MKNARKSSRILKKNIKTQHVKKNYENALKIEKFIKK